MRYAAVDSNGKFTGVVYEEINDKIIADRATYGETIVPIDRKLNKIDGKTPYGEPTVEEVNREVVTMESIKAEIDALKLRVSALERPAQVKAALKAELE